MKKIILAFAVIVAMVTPALADVDCTDRGPYYNKLNSDGSIMADIFLLPFTAAVTVMTIPAQKLDPDITARAACVPMAQAKGIEEKGKRIAKKAVKVIQNFN